jgi:MYXO-CTERM domain-containing protein
MGIVNRRNAVLGWAAWQFGKRFLKRKAKEAVPGTTAGGKRPNISAMVLAGGAALAALAFWRKRRQDDTFDSYEPPA